MVASHLLCKYLVLQNWIVEIHKYLTYTSGGRVCYFFYKHYRRVSPMHYSRWYNKSKLICSKIELSPTESKFKLFTEFCRLYVYHMALYCIRLWYIMLCAYLKTLCSAWEAFLLLNSQKYKYMYTSNANIKLQIVLNVLYLLIWRRTFINYQSIFFFPCIRVWKKILVTKFSLRID